MPAHQESQGTSGLIGSAQRALRVLEAVAAAGDGVTAKVVARRTGFKLSTTYHLLNTLVHEGYLIALGHGRGFGLGYKIDGLFQLLCRELTVDTRIRGELAELHERAGAATYYTVFRDNAVVVAAVADSPRYPRAEPLRFGFHEAPHATAFGKVLLASLDTRRRRDYLSGAGLPRLTPSTSCTLRGLESELSQVNRTGVAQEVEEFQPRLACLAAPVTDGTGRVAGAVAFSVPAIEFSRRRTELEQAARSGAGRVSRLLIAASSNSSAS
jgi:DNA-binding IclR family transcriptional regulator